MIKCDRENIILWALTWCSQSPCIFESMWQGDGRKARLLVRRQWFHNLLNIFEACVLLILNGGWQFSSDNELKVREKN